MSEYHDMALCDLRPLNSPAAIRDRGSRRPPDRATAGTVCAPPGKGRGNRGPDLFRPDISGRLG